MSFLPPTFEACLFRLRTLVTEIRGKAMQPRTAFHRNLAALKTIDNTALDAVTERVNQIQTDIDTEIKPVITIIEPEGENIKSISIIKNKVNEIETEIDTDIQVTLAKVRPHIPKLEQLDANIILAKLTEFENRLNQDVVEINRKISGFTSRFQRIEDKVFSNVIIQPISDGTEDDDEDTDDSVVADEDQDTEGVLIVTEEEEEGDTDGSVIEMDDGGVLEINNHLLDKYRDRLAHLFRPLEDDVDMFADRCIEVQQLCIDIIKDLEQM